MAVEKAWPSAQSTQGVHGAWEGPVPLAPAKHQLIGCGLTKRWYFTFIQTHAHPPPATHTHMHPLGHSQLRKG